VDAHLCVGQVYVRSFLSLMEYVILTGVLDRQESRNWDRIYSNLEGLACESLGPFKVILDFNTVSAPGSNQGKLIYTCEYSLSTWRNHLRKIQDHEKD
jgi:hypothetical protein